MRGANTLRLRQVKHNRKRKEHRAILRRYPMNSAFVKILLGIQKRKEKQTSDTSKVEPVHEER